MIDYYHLSGGMMEPGSIVAPGNWGRIIRHIGWPHNGSIREMALEARRQEAYPDLPSRLGSAFVFLTIEEAQRFRQTEQGFGTHMLYRVRLVDPAAPSFVTDWRLCVPRGTLRVDWPDAYWRGVDAAGLPAQPIPGIAAITDVSREMLTLSSLRVEERRG